MEQDPNDFFKSFFNGLHFSSAYSLHLAQTDKDFLNNFRMAASMNNAYSFYGAQTKKKVFISFDYDHDEILKIYLVGQAENPDTPFSIIDKSVKEPFVGNWKDKVRARIKNVDVMIVMCGMNMATATGVDAEIRIAQEERIPYFLLCGYSHGQHTRPSAALNSDQVYKWTWDNLKALIDGAR